MKTALERATIGFNQWMGTEPNALLEFSDPTSKEPFQILFYDAGEGDEDEPPLSYLVTAGLSAVAVEDGEESKHAELVMCVEIPFDEQELKPLAEALGRVALAMRSGEAVISPSDLIEYGDIPIFEGMSWFYLSHWGDDEQGECLPGVNPRTELWCINAVFDNESDVLSELSESAALELFEKNSISLDDPQRAPLFEDDDDDGDDDEEMDDLELAQGMQEVIQELTNMAADQIPSVQKRILEARGHEVVEEPEEHQGFEPMILVPVVNADPSGNVFHPGWRPSFSGILDPDSK
jgi:hypothetical protein